MTSRSVNSDAFLYTATAVGTAFLTTISTEEAYKYCWPVLLFWLKCTIGASISGANALKAFRSMTFGRFAQQEQAKQEKKDSETQFFTKQQQQQNEKTTPSGQL